MHIKSKAGRLRKFTSTTWRTRQAQQSLPCDRLLHLAQGVHLDMIIFLISYTLFVMMAFQHSEPAHKTACLRPLLN
jgi:hypothetical protein